MITTDDFISVLQFFNRRQLLTFVQINKFTKQIVENNFANKPLIYSNLQLLFKSNIDGKNQRKERRMQSRMFCLKLGALCCDCEQMLHINQQFMYKKERCDFAPSSEDRIEELRNLYGPERAAQHERFDFEHIGHELCPDWELTQQIDKIDEIRQTIGYFFSGNCFYTQLHTGTPCEDNCRLWQHPVHDDPFIEKQIVGQCKFQHRQFFDDDSRPCDQHVQLGTSSGEQHQLIYNHLQASFVKIYKLDLTRKYWQRNWDNNGREIEMEKLNEHECRQYLDVVEWLLDNGKISPAANVSVDLALFINIFDRLNICVGGRTKLLGALSNCAHLNLSGECQQRGCTALYGNAFLNSSFMKIGMKMDVENIKELLYNYNPGGDHRKLISFQDGYEHGTIVQSLLEDFMCSDTDTDSRSSLTSTSSNAAIPKTITYFGLFYANIQRHVFPMPSLIHHNKRSGEILRIMPVNSFSFGPNDSVSIYVARYPFANKNAVEEFATLADQLERHRLALWEKMSTYSDQMDNRDDMDEQRRIWSRRSHICHWMGQFAREQSECFSVGAFLAHIFPSTASSNSANSVEHYNGDFPMNHSVFLPPIDIKKY